MIAVGTEPKKEGYLFGKNCSNCSEFQQAKKFINEYIPDAKFNLDYSCFYLNNYNHV